MLLPGIKDTNVYTEWPTFSRIKRIFTYSTPECSTPLESSLWEPSLGMCQNKVRLGQSSQIKANVRYTSFECRPIRDTSTHSHRNKQSTCPPTGWKKWLGEITLLCPVIVVFFLATEQQLASLLNTCKSGNLPATDQQELSSLIMDYFVPNGSDPVVQWCMLIKTWRSVKYTVCVSFTAYSVLG